MDARCVAWNSSLTEPVCDYYFSWGQRRWWAGVGGGGEGKGGVRGVGWERGPRGDLPRGALYRYRNFIRINRRFIISLMQKQTK